MGIRPGEKIHEILISEEEMRFARSQKDHYIIGIENYEYDQTSTKKSLSFKEYDSGSKKFMTITQLKKLMKEQNWVK